MLFHSSSVPDDDDDDDGDGYGDDILAAMKIMIMPDQGWPFLNNDIFSIRILIYCFMYIS